MPTKHPRGPNNRTLEKLVYVSAETAANRIRRYFPPARNFTCKDCGKPARDYDHYLGYGENWDKIEPVCRSCHMKREFKRGNLHPGRRLTQFDSGTRGVSKNVPEAKERLDN